MKLSSAKQVAAEVGVTGNTIRNWTNRGVITAELIVGGFYRYDLAKVKRQLAAATAAAVKQPEPNKLPTYL